MRNFNLPVSPVLLARYLFFFTAAILDIFALMTLVRMNDNRDKMVIYAVYALLMFLDAAAMVVCGAWINKRKSKIYWFAVILLGLNIIQTIFDQFGMVDFLFLLLNVITLAILISARKELFRS